LFGGTSAAAPLVSGVVALMLEANPELGWRDVRTILAKSAKKVDTAHPDWQVNGAGLNINHDYGFGLVDAQAAIELALTWRNLPPIVTSTLRQDVMLSIPDGDANGVASDIVISQDFIVEFVDVFFDVPDHPRLGDLEVILVSPSGTQSMLSQWHNQTFEVFRYNNWRFGSLRHLGERSGGLWRLEVKDKRTGNIGNWQSWTLNLHGHYG